MHHRGIASGAVTLKDHKGNIVKLLHLLKRQVLKASGHGFVQEILLHASQPELLLLHDRGLFRDP